MADITFQTKNGPVRALDQNKTVRVTRLRYAKPPVGERRFALPELVEPWTDTLDCSGGTSPVPPQLPSRLAKVMGSYPTEQDEDCLHLDIWLPSERTGPLPVLVFLHGGAFMTGGGGMSCYDGSALAAREGLVVVNISYRLGALGFLPIKGVAPANLGLRDQELALRFIRACISDFGGDADNITVSGQSAGGYSIQALQTLQDAAQLFDKAIIMSSPMGLVAQNAEEREPVAEVFLDGLGTRDPDAIRRLPVEAILKGQVAVLQSLANQPDNVAPPFMPVLDDWLTTDPVRVDAAKAATWCPMIIGVTREEHAAFHFEDAAFAERAAQLLPQRFQERYGEQAEAELARARATRHPSTDADVLCDFGSRTRFVFGTFDYIEAADANVWAYLFSWQAPNPHIGACHCIDLPFLFGNLDNWKNAPMLKGARASEMAGIAEVFGGSFAAFARSGTPEAGTAITWPTFSDGRAYCNFDRRVTVPALRRGEYPC